jgi:anti-anti-sigma factor
VLDGRPFGSLPGAMLRTQVTQLIHAFRPERLPMPRRGTAPPLTRTHPTLVGQIADEGTRTIVVLRGEADFSTTVALSDILARGVSAGIGDVVVDLGGLEFIDTGAVRVLTAAQQRLQRLDRNLTIRSPSSVAARVLELFGLSALVENLPETTP